MRAALVALAVLVATLVGGSASAVVTQDNKGWVKGHPDPLGAYVAYAAPNGSVQIQTNNMAMWTITPCRREDGRACWWDASTRGNGRGRSFYWLRGEWHPLPERLIVRY